MYPQCSLQHYLHGSSLDVRQQMMNKEDTVHTHTHTHTLEYYSAIKRNEVESVEVMWMNLESVIQSELSQKEKAKHRILTHIHGF